MVLEVRDGWAFGWREKDGHVGYVEAALLGPDFTPTHWVAVRTTWALARPKVQSAQVADLHMTTPVTVTGRTGAWAEIAVPGGTAFVPAPHCRTLEEVESDPVAVAEAYLGTPYLWAGNTGFGIDCSGLVQVAFHACGRVCPPDSDLQPEMPGERLSADDVPERGDLIFWKGHVVTVHSPGAVIHSNGHHMITVIEPLEGAVARISATERPVTVRLRPVSRPGG